MAELKTKQTDESVKKFLDSVKDEKKRNDCFEIIKIMKAATCLEPKMWGTSIIGFGKYHYKYESGREGEMCLVGFSPRKQNITLYLMVALSNPEKLLKSLGKYKVSGGCLYINKLDDVDTGILKQLISECAKAIKNKYE
jgi:hypothetical protein